MRKHMTAAERPFVNNDTAPNYVLMRVRRTSSCTHDNIIIILMEFFLLAFICLFTLPTDNEW